MQLIGTLAAGVVGAENGYARIFVRGSTKRARYYEDFEGMQAVDFSDVQLDSNGGAVVYTNVTVDVFVYGENDLLIRRWVEASTAACVEVISPSFTGADYETGVGGPNKPTTLAAVFDRLLTSFGAEDFNVKLPDGSEVTLQEAFGSLLPTIYKNVKSPLYGAIGDNVANDRPAIQAAIDAAYLDGGGTVFFPAGTYRLDDVSLLLPGGVNLVGSGAAASKLVSPSIVEPVIYIPGPLFSPPGSPASQIIQALGFSHTLPAGKITLRVNNGYKVTVRSCLFEVRSEAAVACESGVTLGFDDCDFDIMGAGAAIDTVVLGSGPRAGRVDVRRCRFVMRGTGTNVLGIVRGASVHLFGCVYDGTLSGVSNAVVVSANGGGGVYGSVRCCEFIDSATRPIICMALDSVTSAADWFTEDGNFLTSLNAGSRLYSGTYGATVGYYCRLGTRESRIKSLVTALTAITLTEADQFGIHNVRFTGAANFSIDISASAPLGARVKLLVVNGDVASRTLTFGAGARGGSFVIGAGKMIGFELVRAVAHNGITTFASWFTVGTSGILTTGTDSGYSV